MITLETRVNVEGLRAQTVFEFLLNATDRDYQTWWPGVHLSCRTLKRFPAHVGNVVYFDQFIGDYRVKHTEVIVEAVPCRRIVRQIVKGPIRLPVRIVLEMEDDDAGVSITHTIFAGYSGRLRVLDPACRMYFSDRFAAAMDEHLKAECRLLRNLSATPTVAVAAR
ncbi:MAG: hypothetical protein C0483_04925 [Pirellula sp.]|nr:hypothetical protein [Pirellula sp.]